MKRIIRYQCELCGAVFDSEDECHAHSIAEAGISQETYSEYRRIRTRIARASSTLNLMNNDKTREEYDKACEAEVKFVEKYGVSFDTLKKL